MQILHVLTSQLQCEDIPMAVAVLSVLSELVKKRQQLGQRIPSSLVSPIKSFLRECKWLICGMT